MTVLQIKVERYYNPTMPGSAGYMAHSDDMHAAGVYGFGRDEQEAVNDFAKNLQNDVDNV